MPGLPRVCGQVRVSRRRAPRVRFAVRRQGRTGERHPSVPCRSGRRSSRSVPAPRLSSCRCCRLVAVGEVLEGIEPIVVGFGREGTGETWLVPCEGELREENEVGICVGSVACQGEWHAVERTPHLPASHHSDPRFPPEWSYCVGRTAARSALSAEVCSASTVTTAGSIGVPILPRAGVGRPPPPHRPRSPAATAAAREFGAEGLGGRAGLGERHAAA